MNLLDNAPIRYLVADDNHLFRSGFVGLLAAFTDIELVAEASSGATALAEVEQHRPQVVLLDFSLPATDGVHATRAVLAAAPATAVCLLTMAEQQADLRGALAVGVRGFLPKDSAIDAVHQAITTLAAGGTAMPPSLAFQLLGAGTDVHASPTPSSHRFDALTAREREVVYGLAQQWQNEQIAAHLGISVRTVKAHVGTVLKTLGIRNRRQVLSVMQQLGVLTPTVPAVP